MPARDLPLVLRYWQSVLRQEEILGTRPRARKVQHPLALNDASVASPAGGQDYVKLPSDLAEPLLTTLRGHVLLPATGECGAFFETWLAAQYKRADDNKREYLAAFPTLLSPRSELAGLLRTGVTVEWRTPDDKPFQVPTAAQRAKKQLPAPPAQLRVAVVAADPGELPFFVDTRVMRDVLRIDEERIERFMADQKSASPTPTQLIERLCELLKSQVGANDQELPSNAPQSGLLRRLTQLTAQRLKHCRSSAQVFDVALVLDASRNRTTYHVQRDIQAALELIDAQAVDDQQPLSLYVGSKVAPPTHRTLLGRFGHRGLTASQREAGESCLGSNLCAVQGPPGTGKTHLILNLAAHQLVINVLPLLEVLQPLSNLMVITSTNNRAVDNVVTPLCNELGPNRLPLALRVGSREIVDKVTTSELARAVRWLERQQEPSAEEWENARKQLAESFERIQSALERTTRARVTADKLAVTKLELASLESALSEPPTSDTGKGWALSGALQLDLVQEHAASIVAHCTALAIRLRALSQLSAPDKQSALRALEQHYKLSTQRHVGPLQECLKLELPLGLPLVISKETDVTEQRAAWEEACEAAIEVVQQLEAIASTCQARAHRVLRKEALTRDIATLEQRAETEGPPDDVDWSVLEPQLQDLFAAACVMRECWARKNKVALLAALQRVIGTCQSVKSLRSLLANDKGPGVWLKRLYPVWGCTLLSLGNTFEPNPGEIEQVIVDEAGQCHPAYAVSALLRAKRTLMIGDTNQLEPVVDLALQDESRFVRHRSATEKARLEPFRVYEGTENSAQSIADRAVLVRPTLRDHFRCQPDIARICEQLCRYGMVAHTPPASSVHLLKDLSSAVLFAPVSGAQTRYAGSWANQAEANEVQVWLQKLLQAGVKPADIGVITPFRGQLELLWQRLRALRLPLELATASEEQEQLSLPSDFARGGIALGTVHRFQGGERRIIVFSTTVTETQSLRFLDARVNLINVAASRAREHLITIGHKATLSVGVHTQVLIP
jgi:hypothetical protein